MSCLGCSSKQGPICPRCRTILARNRKGITEMNDLTPRSLACIFALQGLLASGRFYEESATDTAYVAIDTVDALFEALEKDNE